MKQDKHLYTTTITRVVSTDVTKTEKRDGKDVSVTEKIDKEIPVKLVIRNPTRKERDDADEYYSIELSNLISKGVLTKHMLRKKIIDGAGGFLTNTESQEFNDVLKKMQNLETEYQRLLLIADKERTPEDKEKLDKIQGEWAAIQSNIMQLEQTQQSLFNHTAENIASNKLVTYFVLGLSCVEEGSELKPIFEGKTLEQKYQKYDEIESGGDKFWLDCFTRSFLVVALWRNGIAETQEEFDASVKKITEKANPVPEVKPTEDKVPEIKVPEEKKKESPKAAVK
jgi:hypothetical protein